jgi:hypothetical protein
MKGVVVLIVVFLLFFYMYKNIREPFLDEKDINSCINYLNYLSRGMDHKVSSFPK